jgi:hypothetical protein
VSPIFFRDFFLEISRTKYNFDRFIFLGEDAIFTVEIIGEFIGYTFSTPTPSTNARTLRSRLTGYQAYAPKQCP